MSSLSGLQHAVQRVDSGFLSVKGALSATDTFALLMTLAPGDPLSQHWPVPDAAKAQLREFAAEMKQRSFIHGDLHACNVFWDERTHEATVIDFGNSVSTKLKPKTRPQAAVLMTKKDAENEMEMFLESAFWKTGASAC